MLALSLTQAGEVRYPDVVRHNKVREVANNVTTAVTTFCAVNMVAESALGSIAGIFLPSNANLRIYIKLPLGRKINVTKQAMALRNICPTILGITHGLQ